MSYSNPSPFIRISVDELILHGDINLAVTTEILDEYAEVLDLFYGSKTLGGLITNVITKLPGARKITIHFHFELISLDPDDNKFVDCAIASNSDLIITNDRHFRILKEIPFPKVVTMTLTQLQRFWERR